MRAGATVLLLAWMLASCSDEERGRGDSGAANVAAAPTRNGSGPETAKPKGASVIRPSVAAEVQVASEPEIEPASATVYFDDRSMALDEEARGELDALLATPAMAAGGEIAIRGHSDSRGYDGDNLVASAKRAQAVSDYLRAHGVEEKRMSVIALGEGRPAAPNINLDGSDNPEGRAKNRRVEVEVMLPPDEPDPPAEAEEGANGAVDEPDP